MSGSMQYLLLPDKVMMIYPPDSMLPHIGLPGLCLNDFLATTKSHNQLISAERLIGIIKSGQDLISSLATMVKEDNAILGNLRHDLSQKNPDSIESEHLRDLMSAVDYSMRFKDSIYLAIDAAEKLLMHKKGVSKL